MIAAFLSFSRSFSLSAVKNNYLFQVHGGHVGGGDSVSRFGHTLRSLPPHFGSTRPSRVQLSQISRERENSAKISPLEGDEDVMFKEGTQFISYSHLQTFALTLTNTSNFTVTTSCSFSAIKTPHNKYQYNNQINQHTTQNPKSNFDISIVSYYCTSGDINCCNFNLQFTFSKLSSMQNICRDI